MNLIGGNGQGFFQNLDDQTKTWLHECFGDRPFCINFPGGAEANIATPSTTLKGWGLTEEIINARFGAGQIDENGEGLDKWLGKLQTQNTEPRSYIYDLIDLKAEFPNMEVIWKANIITGNASDAISALQSIKVPLNVSRVVLGNEIYSKGNYNFDFPAFLTKAQPVIDFIRANYPDVKIAVPFAPSIDRADHTRWNNALIANKNLFDAVDVHIYLGSDELPNAFASYPIEKIQYVSSGVYPQLDACFDDFAYDYEGNTKWDDVLTYIEDNFGKEIWMTEFNTQPSGNFGNSVANAAFIFNRFMNYSPRIANMCVHNLVSPDIYGVISLTDGFDINQSTANTRRTGYYALQMASECLNYPHDKLYSATISANVAFWYDNIAEFKPTVTIATDSTRQIKSYTERSLSGQHAYDSFGKIGYLSKTTAAWTPTITAKNRTTEPTTATSQYDAYGNVGFGYVYIEVMTKPVSPKPCKKSWWQFWKKC